DDLALRQLCRARGAARQTRRRSGMARLHPEDAGLYREDGEQDHQADLLLPAAMSGRAAHSSGSVPAISMPKPLRPTKERADDARLTIEATPRSRRICAPRPISRHSCVRSESESSSTL